MMKMMVDDFLVAYSPPLSASAQSLKRKSVVILSFMREQRKLWPTYQHLYSLFMQSLRLDRQKSLVSVIYTCSSDHSL